MCRDEKEVDLIFWLQKSLQRDDSLYTSLCNDFCSYKIKSTSFSEPQKPGQWAGLSHWPVTWPDPTRPKQLTRWPVTLDPVSTLPQTSSVLSWKNTLLDWFCISRIFHGIVRVCKFYLKIMQIIMHFCLCQLRPRNLLTQIVVWSVHILLVCALYYIRQHRGLCDVYCLFGCLFVS